MPNVSQAVCEATCSVLNARLKGNLPHLESTLQMLSRMEWRKQSVFRKVHCVEKIKIQFDSYLQIFW